MLRVGTNWNRFVCGVAACSAALGSSLSLAADDRVITSVYSRTDPSYKRKKLADGSFKKELYAISNGGLVAGTVADQGIEKVNFPQIAGVVSDYLARQNYFLAPDSKSAELLLVIQWGRTIPFNDVNYSHQTSVAASASARMQNAQNSTIDTSSLSPEEAKAAVEGRNLELAMAADELDSQMMQMQLENKLRDRQNEVNARILGYIDEMNNSDDIRRFAGGGDHYATLVSDIEEARYYVLVLAYDFHRALEKKQQKLLWATRISIRAQGNRFDKQVADMIARAAPFFGRDSGKLIRGYEGTVEIGTPEVMGVEEETSAPAKEKKPENNK